MRKRRMSFEATCQWLREQYGEGCWPWPGHIDRAGYGTASVERSSPWYKGLAHRAVFLHLVGPIPAGLQLTHECPNRACVNPAHLTLVRWRHVVSRGQSPAGVNARKTHCKHGHPFSPANTEWQKNGSRRCKTCHAARQRGRFKRAAAPLTRRAEVPTALSAAGACDDGV